MRGGNQRGNKSSNKNRSLSLSIMTICVLVCITLGFIGVSLMPFLSSKDSRTILYTIGVFFIVTNIVLLISVLVYYIGKRRMEEENPHRITYSLFSAKRYFLYLFAMVVCCGFIFAEYSSLIMTFGFSVTAAVLCALGNIIYLSFIIVFFDEIRNKIAYEIPMNRMLQTMKRIMNGDFTARVQPMSKSEKHKSELDILIDDFNVMADELEGMEQIKDGFISNVSHEIKTPLSVIQSYATALQDGDLTDEEKQEYASVIVANSKRITVLVSDILRMSNLEHCKIFSSGEKFNLGESLRQSALLFEEQWEKKNIDVEVDIEDIEVFSDEELLGHVWSNLISNAVKYTSDGGIIKISLKEENGAAAVRISDTGCGIPPEAGDDVYEKFYQCDSSHASEGNGLGLSIVRRIISIVGGNISYQSKLGEGTEFTVVIPKKPKNK